MVVLVDLDEDESIQPHDAMHDPNHDYSLMQRHEIKHEEPEYQDERPNPNVNSFSQALASYPYANRHLVNHHKLLPY